MAQLYDAFSPLILLSLEGYGFCARGEAGDFTDDGGLEVGGRLPTNTSGGGMSEAYLHGFNLITEAVRQVRGTSTNQVDGANWSLVTSGEGVPTGALLLRGAMPRWRPTPGCCPPPTRTAVRSGRDVRPASCGCSAARPAGAGACRRGPCARTAAAWSRCGRPPRAAAGSGRS